jgi:hypothetical protein
MRTSELSLVVFYVPIFWLCRQCLGENIRVTGALGTPAILQDSAALQISDTAWLAEDQWPETSRTTGMPKQLRMIMACGGCQLSNTVY